MRKCADQIYVVAKDPREAIVVYHRLDDEDLVFSNLRAGTKAAKECQSNLFLVSFTSEMDHAGVFAKRVH